MLREIAYVALLLCGVLLGIGLSTGEVAAALLGSDERLEYSIVGDTVNLAHRLQTKASGGEIVASEATRDLLPGSLEAVPLPPEIVKGRQAPVLAYRLGGSADDVASLS